MFDGMGFALFVPFVVVLTVVIGTLPVLYAWGIILVGQQPHVPASLYTLTMAVVLQPMAWAVCLYLPYVLGQSSTLGMRLYIDVFACFLIASCVLSGFSLLVGQPQSYPASRAIRIGCVPLLLLWIVGLVSLLSN